MSYQITDLALSTRQQQATFLSVSNVDGGKVFEFSGLDAVVPIPAALPLFGSALGMIGFIGWKRKERLLSKSIQH